MSFQKGLLLACNPNPTRLVSFKLGTDPKGEKIVYVNGRTVIIRDIHNPTQSIAYSEHIQPATVARISPSGYYCASADAQGNVRIWDVAGSDQVLKLAVKPLGGKINDLAWDGESKRIIVGGEGRERFGATFFMDSGSSCGEIQGHSQPINSLTIRQQRPFRAVTCSDDGAVVFFTGVPYKYERTIRTHTRFVQDVRYSASGDNFASVGSDGKLFLYDGKSGDTVADVSAHKGTITAVSWSSDSTKLTTAGADGVVKIWDAATQKATVEVTVGSDLQSQQNGVVWALENTIVSVSLDGTLNVVDPREGKVHRKILGASKSITAAGLALEPQPTFIAGSFDGSVRAYGLPDGECTAVSNAPEGQISGVAYDGEQSRTLVTSWSSAAGVLEIKANALTSSGATQTPLQTPKSVSSSGGRVAVVEDAGVTVLHEGKTIKQDKKIRLASLTNESDVTEFSEPRGDVISLVFSPNGQLLAGGDTSGRIVLIDVKEKKVLVASKWTSHTSRVAALAFSPDNLRLASAGLDESIYVWSVTRTLKNLAIKNAHPGGLTGIAWQDDETVISAGADGCIRTWKVSGI